jgi:hypothetical protein
MKLSFGLIVVFLLAMTANASPLEEARSLRAKANACEAAGDLACAISAFETALELQPGHRMYWLNMAIWNQQIGNRPKALAWLQEFANAGLYVAPSAMAGALEVALDDPDFGPVLQQIQTNAEPMGEAELYQQISETNLLVEGIAFDPQTGRTFVSTIAERSIWFAEKSGAFTPFVSDDSRLRSLFSLVVDADRHLLWVTSGTLEQTFLTNDEPATTGLFAFDLSNGVPVRHYDLTDKAKILGDLAQAEDGTLYASDGMDGAIWQFAADGRSAQKLDTGEALSSPQGIVVRGKTLFVADYSTGLFRIDLQPKAKPMIRQIPAPAGTSLIGMDGLVDVGDALLAIQNGAAPKRLLRIELTANQTEVRQAKPVLQGHPMMEEPTQGVLVGDHLLFIANAQWAKFAADGSDPKTPREPVNILSLALGKN